MKEQRIVVEIDHEGRITADAEGFSGDACLRDLERLLEGLSVAMASIDRKPDAGTARVTTTQLDTIHLRQFPTRMVKGEEQRYAKFPIAAGKTVLVIDDVCTKGMAFEAARHYLTNHGINVISVGLLKTRNHGYEALKTVTLPNGSFGPNARVQFTRGKTYDYLKHIIDAQATAEMTERLKRYQSWSWPDDVG